MIDVLTDEQKAQLVLGIHDKDAEYEDWTEETARSIATYGINRINRCSLDCDQVSAGPLCTAWYKPARTDAD